MTSRSTDWFRSAPSSPTNSKADTPIFPFLVRLVCRENLSRDEAAAMFRSMIDGGGHPAQIAGVWTALTAKGETFEELAGMASVIRDRCEKVKAPTSAVDIAGTGSSSVKLFNISTAASFVAAGAGLVVAKQSNRGVASGVGSTEVLSELGVRPASESAAAQMSLRGPGLAFLLAPKFHPYLRHIGDIRRSLGIRTCLNVLGLMANPAGVSRQLVGVWNKSLVEPVARAMSLLGSELGWVVHGSDGLDEITLAGKTFVAAVRDGEVRPYVIQPSDFGLKSAKVDHLKVGSAKESADIIREVLSGKRQDEARSIIVLNAAAALVVGGLAPEPMHAARLAEQSIDSGQAQNKLERLIQLSARK